MGRKTACVNAPLVEAEVVHVYVIRITIIVVQCSLISELKLCSRGRKFSPSQKFSPMSFVLENRILVQMGLQPIQPV